MKKANPVIHFELPMEDRQRASDFYTKAFGWKTQMFGEEMGNYMTAATGDVDEHGRPTMPGTINGGFFNKNPEQGAAYPSVVIAVDDIRESMKMVNDAGGEVHGEPMDIPGVGSYVPFTDTEGNRLSLLQPMMQ